MRALFSGIGACNEVKMALLGIVMILLGIYLAPYVIAFVIGTVLENDYDTLGG